MYTYNLNGSEIITIYDESGEFKNRTDAESALRTKITEHATALYEKALAAPVMQINALLVDGPLFFVPTERAAGRAILVKDNKNNIVLEARLEDHVNGGKIFSFVPRKNPFHRAPGQDWVSSGHMNMLISFVQDVIEHGAGAAFENLRSRWVGGGEKAAHSKAFQSREYGFSTVPEGYVI